MATVLGCYWAPGHMRPADLEYMRNLRPPGVRILEADGHKMQRAAQVAPEALLFPRDWALSEQHDDAQRDPEGTGRRHAREWRAKINNWRGAGAALPPDDRIVVVGINEPRVWDALAATVVYNLAWLDECTRLGLRACALNLSVGWPANDAPGALPNWKPYAAIEGAIKRGGHFLALHEYWYRTGPADNWGWWAGRLLACPWDVPIVVGECGIDLYVDMGRWNGDGRPARGWQGNVTADVFASQMRDYARRLDTRVKVILPFLTDYYDNRWASFDTGAAHADLLRYAGAMVPQADPPGAGAPELPPEPAPGELVHPLPGAAITQHWGQEAPAYGPGMWGHSGTDLAGPAEGAPVRAIAAGLVVWSDYDTGYGNYVRVEHKELGLCSFYGHLREPGRPAGTELRAGEPVGNLGSTGNSTGPHLHFELRLINERGNYRPDCPMPLGRIDPETWCALHGLEL